MGGGGENEGCQGEKEVREKAMFTLHRDLLSSLNFVQFACLLHLILLRVIDDA